MDYVVVINRRKKEAEVKTVLLLSAELPRRPSRTTGTYSITDTRVTTEELHSKKVSTRSTANLLRKVCVSVTKPSGEVVPVVKIETVTVDRLPVHFDLR